MQLHYIEATRALKKSEKSTAKSIYIAQNIHELVDEILYHYQDAKRHNELPTEFQSSN